MSGPRWGEDKTTNEATPMQKANPLKLSAIALLSALLMAPQIAKSDTHVCESKFTENMRGEILMLARSSDIDLSDSTTGTKKVVAQKFRSV